MSHLIERLKGRSIHNEKLALVRFLLAFGMMLTLLFNNIGTLTNQQYNNKSYFLTQHVKNPSKAVDRWQLFTMMPAPAAKTVIIIMLLCVMSGYLPQVTGVLHLWACYSVNNYFIVVNGGEQIGLVMAVLLLPLCLTDPRINQWRHEKLPPSRINIFAGIGYMAIQLQAAVVYLNSGVAKVYVKEWQDGTAVYYYSSHFRLGAPEWLRRINELITLTPLVALVSWGIILFEIALFGCFFANAKVKRAFLLPALLFHFLIIINFGLISFFFTMAALLIVLLDDDNRTIQWIPARIRGVSRQPATAAD